MRDIVLITGATSGIGEATARLLAADYRLIICGRRQPRLTALQDELAALTEVQTLCFDVRDSQAVQQAISGLPSEWQAIAALINNAGNAFGWCPLQEGNIEDWDKTFDTNVKGLLYVTKAVMPSLIKQQSGFIINIASIAGKEVYPNGNIYCASKHAVAALTEALKMELNEHGIRVCAINPGMVETEFSLVRYDGDQQRADKTCEGMTPLTAMDVAETIQFVLNRPAHVKISDITLWPTDQATATMVRRR